MPLTMGAALRDVARTARSKTWWGKYSHNMRVAKAVASRTIGGSAAMSSITRWGAVGAGIGAMRGAADNIVGEDRVSVLGGAMQGAIMLGGLRAMKVGMNTLGRRNAAAMAKNAPIGPLFKGNFPGKMGPAVGRVPLRGKVAAAMRRMRPPARSSNVQNNLF